jgi:tRNA threonylcarbamoyladenosine biosynthesis protein TsaE
VRLHSDSVATTRLLGAAVAQHLHAGDVVVLSGDLGGGKTAFVQGAVRALGSVDLVTSPTFTIVQEYDAPVAIVHVDAYRLRRLEELYEFGFDELIDSERIVFIEWGELIYAALPDDQLVVRLMPGQRDDERVVSLVAHGPRWVAALPALRTSLARFAPAEGTTC